MQLVLDTTIIHTASTLIIVNAVLAKTQTRHYAQTAESWPNPDSVVDPVKNYLSSSLNSMQNLIAVRHTVWVIGNTKRPRYICRFPL